jgi:hypothetical protein
VTKADVAELVDATDLKSLRSMSALQNPANSRQRTRRFDFSPGHFAKRFRGTLCRARVRTDGAIKRAAVPHERRLKIKRAKNAARQRKLGAANSTDAKRGRPALKL